MPLPLAGAPSPLRFLAIEPTTASPADGATVASISAGPQRRRSVLATIAATLVVLVCVITPAVAAAADLSGAEVLAQVNAERAANGIPAGITENPTWSAGCRDANAYIALHGIGHGQAVGASGYTPAGDLASRNSILASAGWQNGSGNPFATAPLHLAQLMSPMLAVSGAAVSSGYTCIWTYPGFLRFGAQNAVYSLPGNGVSGVVTAEVANESPFVPGDLVGLPAGTVTGPHLYVFADGPIAQSTQFLNPFDTSKPYWEKMSVRQASLTGPAGPVELRWVDNSNPTAGPYMGPGAILIPVSPLLERSAYTAHVTMANSRGQQISYSWSFGTGDATVIPFQNPIGFGVGDPDDGVIRGDTAASIALGAVEYSSPTLRLRARASAVGRVDLIVNGRVARTWSSLDLRRERWLGATLRLGVGSRATVRLRLSTAAGTARSTVWSIKRDAGRTGHSWAGDGPDPKAAVSISAVRHAGGTLRVRAATTAAVRLELLVNGRVRKVWRAIRLSSPRWLSGPLSLRPGQSATVRLRVTRVSGQRSQSSAWVVNRPRTGPTITWAVR